MPDIKTRAVAEKAVKTSQQTAKAGIQDTRVVVRDAAATVKKAAQATVTAVKAIIAGAKAPIVAVVAGGWIVAVVIIVICPIELIASSAFGIFFLGENIGCPQEVATMDEAKKELLKEIFWAMNEVWYSINTTAYNNVIETDDGHGSIVETSTTVTETTIYITVSRKTADEWGTVVQRAGTLAG